MAGHHIARALAAAWLLYVHAAWLDAIAPPARHHQLTSGAPDVHHSTAWASTLLEEAARLLKDHPEALDPDHHGGSYGPDERLAFVYARAALQLAPGDYNAGRLTALLAESSYPYFFSWAESQRALSGAMGAAAAATYTARVRQRHPTRWGHWQRSVAAPEPRVPLPPPSATVTPFRTAVLVWDLPEEQLGDLLRALEQAAVGLFRATPGLGPTASAGRCNEAFYAEQNRWQSIHQASLFANGSTLLGVEGTCMSAPTAAAASEAFLTAASGLNAAQAERIAAHRGLLWWAGIHTSGGNRADAHAHHRHDLSAVSGVVFLSSGGSSGQSLLRFSDPRGESTVVDASAPGEEMAAPRPPFVSEMTVHRREGDWYYFRAGLGTGLTLGELTRRTREMMRARMRMRMRIERVRMRMRMRRVGLRRRSSTAWLSGSICTESGLRLLRRTPAAPAAAAAERESCRVLRMCLLLLPATCDFILQPLD